MYKQESVQEKESHYIVGGFEIKRISVRRSDLLLINKKKLSALFCRPGGLPMKINDSEKIEKYKDLARDLKFGTG